MCYILCVQLDESPGAPEVIEQLMFVHYFFEIRIEDIRNQTTLMRTS
jgi:hypothetical protein